MVMGTSTNECKVCFEVSFPLSQAAFGRFGRALIEYQAELVNSFSMGASGGTAFVLVRLAIGQAEAFRAALRPIDWKYKSPTRYDNGTLRPLFASPEDEAAACYGMEAGTHG